MNKELVKYEIKENIISLFMPCIFYGLVVGCMLWILDREILIVTLDAVIVAFVFFDNSFGKISSVKGHRCFGYSRKIQFRNSFFSGMVVAGFMTFIRTVFFIFAYDEYIRFFIEDTENTAEMYHMPFIPEVLIANFLIFGFIMLVRMILATTVLYSTKNDYTIVMQERAAKLGKKCMAVKVCFFIFAVVVLTLFVILYMWMCEILCQNDVILHLVFILGFLIADIIMYFIAKKRYSPKYI
ncbi:MAG: hypothetical protein HDT40_04930 [Lachnospiraceae bacterium]|nr:hypothetical protein [Lachnospiraceae bacterium]